MGQTTLILMIITVISKIFGFVRESVMAAYIGAGELKSIYTTAMTIPNVLTWIVATGIISSYIPIYNRVENEKGLEEADKFTSNLINIFLIYGLVAFIIVFIFARPLSKLFSPDLVGEQLELATNFTRIIIFAIFAFLYSSIIRGYLNIKGNFIDPAITGFILNIFIVGSTILAAKTENPYVLIIGALIANIVQYIRYPFVSKKLGYKHRIFIDFKSPYVKNFMILFVPIMISSAVDQLSLLIDNSMASAFFGVASISKIFYAKTMLSFIMGVVTLSVTTVTFPAIAKAGQNNDIKELKEKTSSAIVFSMLLVIPATLGMMTLSHPIIKIAFERNAFISNDTNIVASLLIAYAPYIIFTSIIKILSNSFYSVGDSKTPVIIVLIQQLINILLNVLLVNFFGVDGIGYATSISTLLCSVLLVLQFYNKLGKLDSENNIITILKILLASILMCILAKFIFEILYFNLILSLLFSVTISGIMYLLLIKLMKVDEFEQLYKSLVSRISK